MRIALAQPMNNNRGTHGVSSLMLSTVVLSNENQTCPRREAPAFLGGEDVTKYPCKLNKKLQKNTCFYFKCVGNNNAMCERCNYMNKKDDVK